MNQAASSSTSSISLRLKSSQLKQKAIYENKVSKTNKRKFTTSNSTKKNNTGRAGTKKRKSQVIFYLRNNIITYNIYNIENIVIKIMDEYNERALRNSGQWEKLITLMKNGVISPNFLHDLKKKILDEEFEAFKTWHEKQSKKYKEDNKGKWVYFTGKKKSKLFDTEEEAEYEGDEMHIYSIPAYYCGQIGMPYETPMDISHILKSSDLLCIDTSFPNDINNNQ